MSRPAPRKPGQPDPLSDAFAAAYAEGLTVDRVAHRFSVHPDRVSRTLRERKGFEFRTIRCHTGEQMARLAKQAQAILDEAIGRRIDPAPRLAAGTSHGLRLLRDQARRAGPAGALCGIARQLGAVRADDVRIAAAHAAGLTLDDIHEVFAVPPREAVRAIAAHAGR